MPIIPKKSGKNLRGAIAQGAKPSAHWFTTAGEDEVYANPDNGEGFLLPASPDVREEALSRTMTQLKNRMHAHTGALLPIGHKLQ